MDARLHGFGRRLHSQKGLTLLEIIMTVVVAGILGAVAIGGLGFYGSGNRMKNEAAKLVDNLWELRSMAVTGQFTPCIDFPATGGYRLFRDRDEPRNGYDEAGDDELIREVIPKGGLQILSVEGGSNPNNYICFEGRGVMGSADGALRVKLGFDLDSDHKLVELLPSTGMAKVF